jgi:hypothetical protein
MKSSKVSLFGRAEEAGMSVRAIMEVSGFVAVLNDLPDDHHKPDESLPGRGAAGKENRPVRCMKISRAFLLPSAGDLHRVRESGIRNLGLILLQGNTRRRGIQPRGRAAATALLRSRA